ncbi:ABC transporter ATP-binding protein [Notoacmeibacter ruber]|uniref:ABC transporter ATP-binding protein n=1 Tax=Notoacmeibacter ruber TaxID=2670375 RepID=A0A3L7J4S4_9HYPH|nr:ABC transporter ATP-binding protein [Notoacmeibacter ruber]
MSDLSVTFRRGVLTALIGPNGCGKSTLLKAILRLVDVSNGKVTLDGQDIETLGRRDLARRVAYLPQESACPDYMTLGELVELGGHARRMLLGGPSDEDRRLFADALRIVGLEKMAHRQMNTLSGGQRQRAWIAMVLAQNADIILMDEPVNHLDVTYQYSVLELIRDLIETHGKTVVAVLHDLNLAAAFADDVVMMAEGRIVSVGPVRETLDEGNIRRVFGVDADVFERGGRLVCLPQRAERTPSRHLSFHP